jgi:hypothetical protein
MSGKGSFKRMQARMSDDIHSQGVTVYNSAVKHVKHNLTQLCDRLEHDLESKVADMLDGMDADYTNAIIGHQLMTEDAVSRREIAKLLEQVDNYFEHALRDV